MSLLKKKILINKNVCKSLFTINKAAVISNLKKFFVFAYLCKI